MLFFFKSYIITTCIIENCIVITVFYYNPFKLSLKKSGYKSNKMHVAVIALAGEQGLITKQ